MNNTFEPSQLVEKTGGLKEWTFVLMEGVLQPISYFNRLLDIVLVMSYT